MAGRNGPVSVGSQPRDAPWARFDDLRTGTALICRTPQEVLIAERPEDVVGVLSAVEQATDAGHWAFGYLAYEAAAGLSSELAVHRSTPLGLPLAWFGICGRPVPVPVLEQRAARPARHSADISWAPTWTPADHARRVAQIKDRIAAGDTYQCNLTERMVATVPGEAFALYRDLALGQRGAYNAFLDLGRFAVASASPELFFERRGDDVALRPMKGTARRGRFPQEDRALIEQLRSSEKERAENVMIVDLMRNDIARVAAVGSVRVPALFVVERYPTVLQLTSDVTARLRPGVGLLDLFRAVFPCGSVTGAPKASSMRVIRAVEPEPRGVYCGAVGLVGPPSEPVRARFNVAIRTAVVDTGTGRAVYGTGSGITWGSDPIAEHEEMVAKTAVLSVRPAAFELLETMRHDPATGLRNRARHLGRMAESADHLGFRFNRSTAIAVLKTRLRDSPSARVRLRLGRDGTLSVDVEPLARPAEGPVLLGIDSEPVDPMEWWLYHKTTRREPYDLRHDRRPDVDDVIMINTADEVTEVTRASFAIMLDGQWWTPPVTSGCLPGVERGRLIASGRLRERVIRLADLGQAEDLAVLSSLRGWRGARVDGR